MAIILDTHTSFELSKQQLKLIEQIVAASVSREQCPYGVEVSITLVSNEEIQQLNKTYRGFDKVTDVLSFPLIEFEQPSLFENIDEDKLAELLNLDTKELMLGDIVISLERTQTQADDYGHSFERELGFLIVHSMLHLFGYDHLNCDEEKKMFEIQEIILKEVGLSR